MAKFYFFEKIVSLFYTHVFPEPKETYSKPTQLGVTFSSGYLAGVVCAIVSHPADTLVSLMGKADNKGKSITTIAKETGVVTLATKGLGTRVLMIGRQIRRPLSLTLLISCLCRQVHSLVSNKKAMATSLSESLFIGFQWWIYDSFKSAMGMGTTGGK
jgi:solute carrier family 25 (mitochondrial phosphate transporter), member 3